MYSLTGLMQRCLSILYLFAVLLKLKNFPEMKAYIGIKSLSCSSLTANNVFWSSLAGVFVFVAFPETKE